MVEYKINPVEPARFNTEKPEEDKVHTGDYSKDDFSDTQTEIHNPAEQQGRDSAINERNVQVDLLKHKIKRKYDKS